MRYEQDWRREKIVHFIRIASVTYTYVLQPIRPCNHENIMRSGLGKKQAGGQKNFANTFRSRKRNLKSFNNRIQTRVSSRFFDFEHTHSHSYAQTHKHNSPIFCSTIRWTFQILYMKLHSAQRRNTNGKKSYMYDSHRSCVCAGACNSIWCATLAAAPAAAADAGVSETIAATSHEPQHYLFGWFSVLK